MSDAQPLPPRPHLDQYRKLARELQDACRSGTSDAVRAWARRFLENLARLRGEPTTTGGQRSLDSEASRVVERWEKARQSSPRRDGCLLADAQFFVAREHGFASWPKFAAHLQSLSRDTPVARFEAAVDAIVGGDVSRLRALLREHPELAKARSTRDHGSTLLHYVSANGVEDFRQITPPNIVEITRLLLDSGADVNAASEAYGGGSTALGLAATSIHPERAGVQMALLELLIARGAEIERPGLTGNKSSAVLGCLANGQPEAARFFADRGARMNLTEAAGVGKLDVVKTFFTEDGRLVDSASTEQMEEGLLYASGYGQIDTVRYLVDRGATPGYRGKGGETPLHWTTFGPHLEVAALLLERGAPVDVRDDHFHATPLDWAVYAWTRITGARDRERIYQLMAMLCRAGAVPDAERFGPEVAAQINGDSRLQAALRGESQRPS
jgi:ankyrin repeat protein